MPPKRQAPKKSRASRRGIDQHLKELVDLQRESNGVVAPSVPDVLYPSIKRGKVFTITRSYSEAQIVVTSGVDLYVSYTIVLQNFPNYTEFTSLFDAYRIGITKVSFTTMENISNTAVTSVFHTAIDYDDATTTNYLALQQYDSHQINSLKMSFERSFQPRAANAAYSGVFTSFAQMPPKTWVDVASPGVLYYGLKGHIPLATFAGGPFTIYDVAVTSVLQFKSTR